MRRRKSSRALMLLPRVTRKMAWPWQSNVMRYAVRRVQTRTLLSAKFVCDWAQPASVFVVSVARRPAHAYPRRPAQHRLTTRCDQRRAHNESAHDRHLSYAAGPMPLPASIVLLSTGMYRALADAATQYALAPMSVHHHSTP